MIHLHGGKFDIYYNKALSIEKSIIRYGFTLADKVVVLSSEWLRKIVIFCDSTKISIISNRVPAYILKGNILKKKNNIPHTILFMGELCHRKGVYDLLEAIKLSGLDNARIRVFLCGNGEIEKVKKRIKELGLEKVVTVPGWISGQEKQKLLDDAYLYVLPSYFEGLPMSILEAMATGTPIVSTPVGGIPDAVENGYNGFLVPANSPKMLASRIQQLLTNEKLWVRFSQNAFETVNQKFSIEQMEKKLHDLYHAIGKTC